MRIVFMGTPDFAASALKAIIDAGLNVVTVYSQPPKPAGRGHKTIKSATHELADKHNIPVLTPTTLKTQEAQEELKALKPDICIVAAYGFILPQAVLDIPPMGCVNIHGSLLPRWRGAAPIQHAILAGDTETGITIMNMDVGMDTGDMLYKESIPITDTTTSQDLFVDMANLGAKMIVKYLKSPSSYPPQKQDTATATLAPKLDKAMAQIDWNETATLIERKLRAFTPWPGLFTLYNGEKIKIGSLTTSKNTHNVQPGTILNNDLDIACGDATVLRINLLQRSGGKMLETSEFLKGYPLSGTFQIP